MNKLELSLLSLADQVAAVITSLATAADTIRSDFRPTADALDRAAELLGQILRDLDRLSKHDSDRADSKY